MADLATKTIDLERLHRRLRRELPADSLVDDVSRGLYATDASIYEFLPLAVVAPRNEEDLEAAVAIAREFGAPILPRGGGTSLAGQAANTAVVLDFSKHLRRVRAVDSDERAAVVETGIVRDELNAVLKSYSLEFAPETSTSNRATIAGMIGNNSSGMRSLSYGRTVDRLLGGRLLLPTGDWIDCVDRTPEEARRLAEGSTAEGRLWKGLLGILDANRSLIDSRFPKVMRRVGGYSLDEFPETGPWNLAKLIAGAEGTLGLLSRARLHLTPPPRHIAIAALHYRDWFESLRNVPALLRHEPLSIELMDRELLALSRTNPSTRDLCFFIDGEPDAILVAEITAASAEELEERVSRFQAEALANGPAYACPVLRSPIERAAVVDLRKKGLGVMLSMTGDLKPVAFVEDACAPPEHQADYVKAVVDACSVRGIRTILYGHASVGVIHIRPVMDLKDPRHLRAMQEIAEIAVDKIKECGGAWSGEHGDGIARGALNERFWGTEMIDAFRSVKRLFDPDGLMNPGRVFDTPPLAGNLRFGESYQATPPKTWFRFESLGGYAGAVEMCNGVGACRKTASGTMCPSYMATRDEEDSTRGRANVLRLAMSGKLGKHPIASEEVHRALDLCLECKACKTECPSNVDMARLKSEHLAHWHKRRRATLRERLLAETPRLARLAAGPWAPILNAPGSIDPLRRFANRRLGIAEERALPPFATRRFSRMPAAASRNPKDRTVVLFSDCWTETMETQVGVWGRAVLEHFGYRVLLEGNACCQRTRISKGFLSKARRDGAKSVGRLARYARKGLPILALEPSCQSSFTDDLPDLVANREEADMVAAAMKSVAEFLSNQEARGRIRVEPAGIDHADCLLHGHCHQKALYGIDAPRDLLLKAGGAVEVVDSGCCGMAGSFGYEAEHYEISQRIGARRLFPAVSRAPEDRMVVADGFSCRHQIADATGRRAMHWVEAFGRAVLPEEAQPASQ